jgi:glycosyltransferase involved in cell wall biosynthesis
LDKKKTILFISGIDFKEKSIQVIRKTPESFAKRGWEVDYLVLRDNSKSGNYFYEKPINPLGIKVYRINYKMSYLLNSINNHLLRTIVNKLISIIGVYQLFIRSYKLLQRKNYDVIYGYEHIGVRTVSKLDSLKLINGILKVSRFQGTWLSQFLKQKRYFKLLLNFDFLIAMRFKSDICIMTNDGTQGDIIIKKLKTKYPVFKFWVNGVDLPILNNKKIDEIKFKYNLENKFCLITVSRLESWKKVERPIKIIHAFKEKYPEMIKNIKLMIIGEGTDRKKLENLTSELNLNDNIIFVGAVNNYDVVNYLDNAKVFMSFYDLSNLGNPLLEAIRSNKIIMTLSNGDTSKWIKHKSNGFIYSPEKNYFEVVAEDLFKLINNENYQKKIKKEIKTLEKEKLWTWEQRFSSEVELIDEKL